MSQTIHTSLSRQEVVDFVRSLPGRISGRVDDPQGVGEGFRARMGFTLLVEISGRFDELSRGGADETGYSWPRNTQRYLAYGKPRKKSDSQSKPAVRMGSGRVNRWPDHPGSGELNSRQRKEWAHLFAMNLAFLADRHGVEKGKQIAAALAWKEMKKRGAKTLLETKGNRPDQVLVDGGDLRRSLLPGEVVEAGAAATYRSNDNHQVFEVATGEVVVGTSRKHAAAHHEGKGNLPERRLWPKTIPDSWWESVLDNCLSGLLQIGELIQRGDVR